MPFNSHLDVRVWEPQEFVLLSDLEYQFTLNGVVMSMVAPRGFITDFASIPWLVQCLPDFDVNGPSRWAAIPHDYLYCSSGRVSVTFLDRLGGTQIGVKRKVSFTRSQCDEIFRMAILDTGKDKFTKRSVDEPYSETSARLFWLGVRAGGWMYWNKRRNGLNSEDFANLKKLHNLEEPL